ncbi:hypothetical protein ACHAXN_000163, partial [Cyclotella atomus]
TNAVFFVRDRCLVKDLNFQNSISTAQQHVFTLSDQIFVIFNLITIPHCED